MTTQEQINDYINSQPESKRNDMQQLHHIIMEVMPGCKLWFLDGKNSENEMIANPNIGYGVQTMHYADGKTREFYLIGFSGNTTGISVNIIGFNDKAYLPNTYKEKIGKASVSGYCIKFKKLSDISTEVLREAITDRMAQEINQKATNDFR